LVKLSFVVSFEMISFEKNIATEQTIHPHKFCRVRTLSNCATQ